jgi:hypothetical protein
MLSTNTIDVARIPEDSAYKDELRWRAQTDLFWLAKFILGYHKLTEEWHREPADVFIKKDPNQPIELQHKKHKRMLLLPRKTYKTTLNISDSVQWILCFPDVALMAMTASNSPDSPLADAFVAEVADHFYCPPGAPQKILHQLFPEHVLTKMPKAGEFTTPARTKYRRDPTVKGVSIEQSLSGWHPDIIKSEDVQDNRNSQTAFSLRKVRTNFYINIKMLGETGFLDVTGTRYGPMDLYGDFLQKMDESWIYLWRPAYIRKPHAMKLEDDELLEGDVILQFPEQISWPFLRAEKNLDANSFWTQYMNIAEGNFKPTFPMERLEAAKTAEDTTPHDGTVHIAWRFEYGECKYAAAAVGIEQRGRMTIMEVVRDVFTPTALSRRVVGVAKKWECNRIQIEDTPGARSMEQHIQNEALEQAWRLDIHWTEFLQDDTAAQLRVKSAEPHLIAGRLLFSDGIVNAQEVYRQLYHFGMVDDKEIASVVSQVAACLPKSIAAEDFDKTDENAWQAFQQEDAYNRVYGRGVYAEPEMPVPEELEAEEWEAPSNDELSEMMPGLSG